MHKRDLTGLKFKGKKARNPFALAEGGIAA